MNWSAIQAIAELVAASGVLATLVYLAIQVRQSVRAMKAATYQEVYRDLERRLTDIPVHLAERVRLNEAFSDSEQAEFNRWCLVTMRAYENWWQQHQYGTLDDAIFKSFITHMHVTLRRPATVEWWRRLRVVEFQSDFVAFVDAYLLRQENSRDSETSTDAVPVERDT